MCITWFKAKLPIWSIFKLNLGVPNDFICIKYSWKRKVWVFYMTFAPFPILFEYVDSIFYLLENSRFYDFQLWVLQLSMLIFKFGEVFGYHWLYFFKTYYQTFLQLKMPPLTCTFLLCTLDFVIFPENPQICVANVFTCIGWNFHFYFPNVSWFKSTISRLSNALSTVLIALLDPEIF